jgi:hypothetical protein
MNTLADRTRPRQTTMTTRARAAGAHSLRAGARRLAGWWADDPMSASFSAACERDRRLHQRLGR